MKILSIHRMNGLPKEPALIRTSAGAYDIWTGRNWCGKIYKLGRQWIVSTPLCPDEPLSTFAGAKEDAEHKASRYEGKV